MSDAMMNRCWSQHRWISTILMIGIISLITILRIIYLYNTDLNLFFDEAQYWFWAKHPDWGYYSKPPMVAWWIALTTQLCGNGEACIRLSSPLLHGFTSLCVYGIGRQLYNQKVGVLSAITYVTLPAVTVSSALASTDPSLLFFTALSLSFLIRALYTNKWGWWIATGLAVGLGGLSKYTMVLFGVSTVGLMLTHAPYREYLKQPRCYVAGLIALLVMVPNIWWNLQHGFVSFLHTKDNAHLENIYFNISELGEFLGSQFGVFGPILFAVLMPLILRFRMIRQNNEALVLWWFIMPLLSIITTISVLSRAHANWAAPIYVPATVLVIAFLCQTNRRGWIYASLGLHLFLFVFLWKVETIINAAGWTIGDRTDINTQQLRDPFIRLRDWDKLAAIVARTQQDYPEAVLLVDSRKLYAELIYYLSPPPYSMVKWNSNGKIDDHFELVTTLDSNRSDQSFLFITQDTQVTETSLRGYFSEVELVAEFALDKQSAKERNYYIYYVRGFKNYGDPS